MTIADKLRLMVELCAGLAHVHEAGIIHRDIKPANLMVDQQGRLKLLDFGIARVNDVGLVSIAGAMRTHLNVRIGTPGYMSPEQIERGEVDRRSDLFSVGAVFYELLSYREAFDAINLRQIEKQVLHDQPKPLVGIVPGVDRNLEAVVFKALAKDPRRRYQDAGELEHAIEQERVRFGRSEASNASGRATPVPPQPSTRKSLDSRAEVAYQRALLPLRRWRNRGREAICRRSAGGGRRARGSPFAAEQLDPKQVMAPQRLPGLPRLPRVSRSRHSLPPHGAPKDCPSRLLRGPRYRAWHPRP